MTELKITQADRDAAAYLNDIFAPTAGKFSDRIRRGNLDGYCSVQAFARHRITAEEGKAELVELLERFRDHVVRHSCTWDDAINGSHHHPIWLEIAEALARVRGEG